MKRILPLLLVLLGPLWSTVQAQRIAFVNTRYILDQLPEYDEAQKELDKLSKQWQDEIDDRHQQIKRMREAYNAEAILLTEEMRRSRLEEIERRDREARDLQKRRFGPGGDLFKKRQELIQPIQDRVYNAVKEVAGTSYVAIFDLGGQSGNLLFASERYDRSDAVLRKLGVRPGKGGAEKGGGRDDDDFGTDFEDGPPSRGGGTTTPPPGREGGGGEQQPMKPR
jgi:outer membrane protein